LKHATVQALDALEPLLAELRTLGGMKEKKRGVFYVKSRAFLHFHEDPAGLFCDVRLDLPSDFERFAVNTSAERRRLLERVARTLAPV
tara:strand:+ start:5796 stop:6059 length:264 start_codon:yes stop_codon:yes gene_type:complete